MKEANKTLCRAKSKEFKLPFRKTSIVKPGAGDSDEPQPALSRNPTQLNLQIDSDSCNIDDDLSIAAVIPSQSCIKLISPSNTVFNSMISGP